MVDQRYFAERGSTITFAGCLEATILDRGEQLGFQKKIAEPSGLNADIGAPEITNMKLWSKIVQKQQNCHHHLHSEIHDTKRKDSLFDFSWFPNRAVDFFQRGVIYEVIWICCSLSITNYIKFFCLKRTNLSDYKNKKYLIKMLSMIKRKDKNEHSWTFMRESVRKRLHHIF